jgi:transposase
MLTVEIDELTAEITAGVATVAPSLLAIVGCEPLTAAKIVGETAQPRLPLQRRFRPS